MSGFHEDVIETKPSHCELLRRKNDKLFSMFTIKAGIAADFQALFSFFHTEIEQLWSNRDN